MDLDDLEFVQTGVDGLDDLMERGILSGSVTLIVGNPGSGKSIFGLQTLHHAAEEGETGLYISLEEDRERLLAHMQGFEWVDDDLLDGEDLLIEDYDPFSVADAVEGWLAEEQETLSMAPMDTAQPPVILQELEDHDPDRVVVDSLTAVSSAFSDDDRRQRRYISSLFRYFRENGIDAFVIVESQSLPDQITESGQAEFLADGVILLHRQQHARGIEVFKMRGSSFREKVAPMSIEPGDGIVVRPDEQFFPEDESGNVSFT